MITAALLTDAGLLPRGVTAFLDSYQRSHPELRVRLWGQREDGCRTLLYPEGGEFLEPVAESARCTITIGEEAPFELEIEGNLGAAEDLAFLAASLSQLLSYEREARSAARELTERYEEINLLYSISEILGSFLSLEVAAERILSEVADVLGAKRASLWVYDRDAETLRLAAAEGEDGLRGPIPIEDPHSVTAKVFRDRQPLNLEKGTVLPRGTRLEPRPHGREAFLSVPINYTPPEGEARTVGVITLVGGGNNQRFSAGDSRLLSAVASQVGAALETQRLVQESLRRERLERELELAHDLQLKLLPETTQFSGRIQVAARCAPAESVGGDFYHLFRLSGDRLGVTIGDVSGHGFSAALIMALTMSTVAIYAQEGEPPGEVLRRVHSSLKDELESTEMYLSFFYAVVDPDAGRLIYANAGHPHAFCIRREGRVERLLATDPPLGMVPLDRYPEAVLPWEQGEDLLCLFTDGLSDAFVSEAGSGEPALLERIVQLRLSPPGDILTQIFAQSDNARLNIPPDDRTAVLVRT